MDINSVQKGIKVRVAGLLEKDHGLQVPPSFISCRALGVIGIVLGPVAGHSGAWWVRHQNGAIAAYWYYELVQVFPAPRPLD